MCFTVLIPLPAFRNLLICTPIIFWTIFSHFHCINGCNFILRIMKSKQVLSIEQMKHLQELGLDTSDASMYWARVSHGSRIYDNSKGKWFLSLQKEFQTCGFISYETLPAYTLQDILDKLPTLIIISSDFYKICIEPSCGYWDIYYYKSDATELISKKSENIIDVAYDMLCWCIENGHLETNK